MQLLLFAVTFIFIQYISKIRLCIDTLIYSFSLCSAFAINNFFLRHEKVKKGKGLKLLSRDKLFIVVTFKLTRFMTRGNHSPSGATSVRLPSIPKKNVLKIYLRRSKLFFCAEIPRTYTY